MNALSRYLSRDLWVVPSASRRLGIRIDMDETDLSLHPPCLKPQEQSQLTVLHHLFLTTDPPSRCHHAWPRHRGSSCLPSTPTIATPEGQVCPCSLSDQTPFSRTPMRTPTHPATLLTQNITPIHHPHHPCIEPRTPSVPHHHENTTLAIDRNCQLPQRRQCSCHLYN